jgi:hypothetical protein
MKSGSKRCVALMFEKTEVRLARAQHKIQPILSNPDDQVDDACTSTTTLSPTAAAFRRLRGDIDIVRSLDLVMPETAAPH